MSLNVLYLKEPGKANQILSVYPQKKKVFDNAQEQLVQAVKERSLFRKRSMAEMDFENLILIH